MTSRVLMVDDEEDLVWTTGRQARRERPDLDVEGVTDPHEALARIRERCPDLLITDVRMPQMSGLELLLAARQVCPQLPVIVVTAHGNTQVRTEVQRAHAVQYLEKPFSFQALFAAVDRALARPTGFSGAISLPMLPDLVQMYALGRMTGALRIARGAETGALWFEGGEIVHAVCGGHVGPDAVYGLLAWEGGTFSMDAGAAPPQRTVASSWQELLMEGCRLLDEGRRDDVEPVRADPAPAGGVPEAARRLWQAVGPRVLEASPSLVVAVGLEEGAAVVLHGEAQADAWPDPVHATVLDAVTLASGAPEGTVECVGPDLGLAVVWDRRAALALVVAETLAGPTAASRFRSNLARWGEDCRRRLAEGA